MLTFMHCIENIGNSPHTTYGMFTQPEYTSNGYSGYATAYHYSTPYVNAVSPGGYPVPVPREYTPATATFGMPPPQHLPQDIKLVSKERLVRKTIRISMFSQKFIVSAPDHPLAPYAQQLHPQKIAHECSHTLPPTLFVTKSSCNVYAHTKRSKLHKIQCETELVPNQNVYCVWAFKH